MHQQLAGSKFCFQCGTQIPADAGFCAGCGVRQDPVPTSVAVPYPVYRAPVVGRKSRLAAILLAFFLGGLGIHKFYLGRPVAGVLYLLFFWTSIPFFTSLVETIIYICMSDEQFAVKYG